MRKNRFAPLKKKEITLHWGASSHSLTIQGSLLSKTGSFASLYNMCPLVLAVLICFSFGIEARRNTCMKSKRFEVIREGKGNQMICTDVMGFSGRLIFHFQINRSGRPVLTFGKRKKSLYSFVWVLRLFFLSCFYLAVYSRKEESHRLGNKTKTLNLTRRGKVLF